MPAKLVHTYPLAYEGLTPEHTITVTRDGDKFKAFTPNVPDLQPRYGETRADAVQACQRQLWAWFANGNNAEAANREK